MGDANDFLVSVRTVGHLGKIRARRYPDIKIIFRMPFCKRAKSTKNRAPLSVKEKYDNMNVAIFKPVLEVRSTFPKTPTS